MDPDIAENLQAVRMDIAESERKSGRPVGSVELLAVSKTHPPEVIRQAVEAGQLLFGENRIQEAKAKIPDLPAKASLAFDRTPAEQQDPSGIGAF